MSARCQLPSIAIGFTLLLLGSTLSAQPGQGQRGSRETTWWAPTAEDWKKPCLIKWQRSYEDALAVSKETGKPVLVCVNMDGEIASEHYAGVRYRQPEIAALYEPYVTVIASTYRHNPRDFDEEGRRILCPRFGSVTCGEHIAIEPGVYDKHLDGRRIAPRHIGVELDGKEMYDVFYAWDTETIFNSLKTGIASRPTPPALVRGDRPILERVASRDNQDKIAVEEAYLAGETAQRRAILEAAVARGEEVPVDLLRLAISGFDTDLAKLGRQALTQAKSESAIDLMAETLRNPLGEEDRTELIAALDRLGETSPRARTLAVVHRGLDETSKILDVAAWTRAIEATTWREAEVTARQALNGSISRVAVEVPAGGLDRVTIDARLKNRKESLASQDPVRHLEVAEAQLALALEADTTDEFAAHLFEEVKQNALKAQLLAAPQARTSLVLAAVDYFRGDMRAARQQSEAAIREIPAAPGSEVVRVALALFAEARERAISRAVAEKSPWPGSWMTDVHAAHAILARHPAGTDKDVTAHVDFLRKLGAFAEAWRALDLGLERFPTSGLLHNRYRNRLLLEHGPVGLIKVYDRRLAELGSTPHEHWFAAYAAALAAEYHRKAGADAEAYATYDRAIAQYERCAESEPTFRDQANHEIAMILGGRARMAFEAKDDERALNEVLASFAKRAASAATLDGLNISTVDTAKMLLARLKADKKDELAAKLDQALKALDPKLLELPAYEFEGRRNAPPPVDR